MAARMNLLLGALSLAYPILAVILLRFVQPVWLIVALVSLLGLRLVLGQGKGAPAGMILAALAAVIGITVTAFFDQTLSIRLYPVFMNAAFLATFAWSLARPPSMIERMARLMEPDLPESGVRYTRKVTWVWVGFLAINTAISLWTALFASLNVWAIWNGGIAYALMGLLFAGEFLVRKRVRAADEANAQ